MTVCAIYTDGACRGNNQKNVVRKGAWGFVAYTDRGSYHQCGRDISNTVTNNQMELLAIERALGFINKNQLTARISTDSEYVYGVITRWLKTLEDPSAPRPRLVKNKDRWLRVFNQLATLRQMDHTVTFRLVRGHASCVGNNTIDKLLNYQLDCEGD